MGGALISDSILRGGGARHFFLLILYNFKNIGGGLISDSILGGGGQRTLFLTNSL